MPPDLRSEQFIMRVSPVELAMLRVLAEASGLSAADVLRKSIRREFEEQFGAEGDPMKMLRTIENMKSDATPPALEAMQRLQDMVDPPALRKMRAMHEAMTSPVDRVMEPIRSLRDAVMPPAIREMAEKQRAIIQSAKEEKARRKSATKKKTKTPKK